MSYHPEEVESVYEELSSINTENKNIYTIIIENQNGDIFIQINTSLTLTLNNQHIEQLKKNNEHGSKEMPGTNNKKNAYAYFQLTGCHLCLSILRTMLLTTVISYS